MGLFDIEAAKSAIEHYPSAKRANCAKREPEVSTISTGTPPESAFYDFTLAELEAEAESATEPAPPALKALAAAGGSEESFEAEADDEDSGPLKFIFRRRKRS